MAEEAKEDEAIDVTPKDNTKKTIILLVALSVLVMVLTPVITIFSIRSMTSKEEVPVETKPSKTKEVVLPQVQVNVADTNGTRFVQVEIVVEVSDPEMTVFFEAQTPENDKGRLKRIMASTISIISDKNLDALVSKEAKIKLAQEIKSSLNDLLHDATDGIVTDVYFYGFLIQ